MERNCKNCKKFKLNQNLNKKDSYIGICERLLFFVKRGFRVNAKVSVGIYCDFFKQNQNNE